MEEPIRGRHRAHAAPRLAGGWPYHCPGGGGGEGPARRSRQPRAVRRVARPGPALPGPAAAMWCSGNPAGGAAGAVAVTLALSGTRDCFLRLPPALASHLRLQQVRAGPG